MGYDTKKTKTTGGFSPMFIPYNLNSYSTNKTSKLSNFQDSGPKL